MAPILIKYYWIPSVHTKSFTHTHTHTLTTYNIHTYIHTRIDTLTYTIIERKNTINGKCAQKHKLPVR